MAVAPPQPPTDHPPIVEVVRSRPAPILNSNCKLEWRQLRWC
jgi:hypothetical protein